MGIDLLTLKKANQARVESYNRPTYGVETLTFRERRDRLPMAASEYRLVPLTSPNSDIDGSPAHRGGAVASGTLRLTTTLQEPVSWYPYITVDYYAEDGNIGGIDVYVYTDTANYFVQHVGAESLKLGLNHLVLNKTGFTAVGSPSWGSITQISYRVRASADGTHVFRIGETHNYSFPALVTIWFDDGHATVYSAAKPTMDQYGFRGVQSIHGAYIGNSSYQNARQIAELLSQGWEHVNHGWKYYRFDQATPDEIEYMMRTGLDYCLTHGFGKSSYYFVNPSGRSTDQSLPIERKYATLRRFGTGYNYLPLIDPFNVRSLEPLWETPAEVVQGWVDRAIEGGLWLVLLFHQIRPASLPGPLRYPKESFDSIMAYLNTKQTAGELKVVTCSEALCHL